MTTTQIAKPATPPGAKSGKTHDAEAARETPAAPRLPGRRNPKWIALGIIAICLGGLLAYVVYSQVATETSVVTVADTVYRGEVIEAGDLQPRTVRGGLVEGAVSADELESLVGKRAVFDLSKGSIVLSNSIADVAVPADGRSAVGLKLEAGQAPATLLFPGSPIRLVALPTPEGSNGKADKLEGVIYLATVIDVDPSVDGTATLVNVQVKNKQAAVVARLASENRLAVVRDAGR